VKISQWSLPVIARAGRPVRNSPRNSSARLRAARGIIVVALAILGLTAAAALSSFHGASSHNAAKAGTVSVAKSHGTGSVIILPWMW
jgi:hypothetical protein